jgi:hypothetical protein
MADRKISDLTALTTPASGDFLPIVDISEAAAASKNKRITIEELMRGVPDGTAAAPGIAFETDPNTGIYSPGADQLAVATNGIGTSPGSYNANLAVYSAGGAFATALHSNSGTFPKVSAISLGSDAVSYTYTTGGTTVALTGSAHIAALQSASSGAGTDIAFINTAGGGVFEKVRITSDGKLLVGTSSSVRSGLLEVAKATADTQIQITESSDSGDGPTLRMTRTRGSSLSSPTPVQDGNFLGRIRFDSYDTAAYRTGAAITANADGQTWASGDCPTRLVFSTTADGASSPTERMRIQSDGNISIGSAASTTYRCALAVASGADRDIFLGGISGASNGFQVNWLHATTALSVKFNSITTTASAANAFLDSADGNRIYRSTSSLRYKKNVENIDQLKADAILSLRPVWYRSKASNDKKALNRFLMAFNTTALQFFCLML